MQPSSLAQGGANYYAVQTPGNKPTSPTTTTTSSYHSSSPSSKGSVTTPSNSGYTFTGQSMAKRYSDTPRVKIQSGGVVNANLGRIDSRPYKYNARSNKNLANTIGDIYTKRYRSSKRTRC